MKKGIDKITEKIEWFMDLGGIKKEIILKNFVEDAV